MPAKGMNRVINQALACNLLPLFGHLTTGAQAMPCCYD